MGNNLPLFNGGEKPYGNYHFGGVECQRAVAVRKWMGFPTATAVELWQSRLACRARLSTACNNISMSAAGAASAACTIDATGTRHCEV
jgi:hypothetical protein